VPESNVATAPKDKMIPGVRLPSGDITPGVRSKRTLRLRNALVASSFELAGKRVLDVGCAEGRSSLYMAALAQDVFGVDHRASEIEIARNTAEGLGITNTRFEAGDVRDPELFKDVGKFDLAIAWGFLHRIGDIFGLLYSLEPIADAISLEWRTPVMPLMSELSVAYHPTQSKTLDPMNTGRAKDGVHAKVSDAEKIEGNASFWEPTPGAVKAIMARLGYVHATLLGYEDELVSEETIMHRWRDHEIAVKLGARSATRLPQARVHMLFEKHKGSIKVASIDVARARLPRWDQALLQATNDGRHGASPQKKDHKARPGSGGMGLRGIVKKVVRRLRPRAKPARPSSTIPMMDTDSERKPRRALSLSRREPEIRRGVQPELWAQLEEQAPQIFRDAASHPIGDPAKVGSTGIQISDLDLSKLTTVKYSSGQLLAAITQGRPLPRAIFRDSTYFYKIWRHDYAGHREVFRGRRKWVAPAAYERDVEKLWAFQAGLFDGEICPAFAGGIYSGTRLVGYRTLAGKPVRRLLRNDPQFRKFVDRLKHNTIKSGLVYSDVRLPNIAEMPDGRLSLIDFDGYLISLIHLANRKAGSRGTIRPKTIRPYREFIRRYMQPEASDWAMRWTRLRLRVLQTPSASFFKRLSQRPRRTAAPQPPAGRLQAPPTSIG
jgi:SAM-dependent methyltransferase